MDELLIQRHVAQTMADKGGDYGRVVKEHPPRLRADIVLVFTLPPIGDRQATAWLVDIGHGHIESAISRRVRPWWATARGPGWRKDLSWDVTSSTKKHERNR